MRSVFEQIIPIINKQVKKQNYGTLIKLNEWICINSDNSQKLVYFFKGGDKLILAKNSNVQKGRWELLNEKSLLIELNNKNTLYYIDFIDSNFLLLSTDNDTDYKILVDSKSVNRGLNTVDKVKSELKKKYISNNNPKKEDNIHKKEQNSDIISGVILILIGSGIIVSDILIFNNTIFRVHVLNDYSKCPCGADISQAVNPLYYLVPLFILVLYGVYLLLTGILKLEKKEN